MFETAFDVLSAAAWVLAITAGVRDQPARKTYAEVSLLFMLHGKTGERDSERYDAQSTNVHVWLYPSNVELSGGTARALSESLSFQDISSVTEVSVPSARIQC